MLIFLFIIFILLQIFDVFSTMRILKNNGKELNCLLNYFIKKIGRTPALILSKLLGVGVITVLVTICPTLLIKNIVIGGIDIFYLFIMLKYNLKVLLDQLRSD